MFKNYYLNLIGQSILFGVPAGALNIWANAYYFTHYPVLVAWLSSIAVACFSIAIFSTIYGTVHIIQRINENRISNIKKIEISSNEEVKNVQYVKINSNGTTTIVQKSNGNNTTQIAIQNNYITTSKEKRR